MIQQGGTLVNVVWRPGLLALVAVSALACRDRSSRGGEVTLHVATRVAADSDRTHAPGDSVVVVRGADSLVIREAAIVLRETVLQRARYQECEEEEGEDCAVLRAGVMRVALPLGDEAPRLVTVPVPLDTYSTLQFEIYRPDVRLDSVFLADHPRLAGASLRVEGTFSRAGARHPFAYASAFNEVQEVLLDGPLPVSPGSRRAVTLRVDVASWFLTADGASLIDPAAVTPDGDAEIQIRDNVRLSLHGAVGAAAPAAP